MTLTSNGISLFCLFIAVLFSLSLEYSLFLDSICCLCVCVCVCVFFPQFSCMRFYGEDAGSSGWTAMAKYGYYGKKFINFDNDCMEMVR